MSLVSELAKPGSELARWCAGTFLGTADVVEEVVTAATGVRPVRPRETAVAPRHWAEVGGAWGQRLADLVEPAPPYYALLGMVRAGWVDARWAHEQAAAYPTHRLLPEPFRRRALDFRPVAVGWLDVELGLAGTARARPAVASALGDVLAFARGAVATHVPVGALGSPGVEAEAARVCWLLAACEEVYRGGVADDRLVAALTGARRPTRVALRGLVDRDQVSELGDIAARLEASGTLAQLHALAGRPGPGEALGIAGPTIVPRWADGDLLVGAIDPEPERRTAPAAGTTLIEVKAAVSLRDADRIARWVWQAVLYALLDHGDLYRIRRVGLLLARHGVLVVWALDELLARLTAWRAEPAAVRAAFHRVAGRALRAAGWTASAR